jgi:hypothetical protein
VRLVAFCEARADFLLASTLVDRVLGARTTPGGNHLDVSGDATATWVRDGRGHDFFDIHRINTYALPLLRRLPQGHFDGRPGAAGAVMARTAFSFVRELNKQSDTNKIDGVVFVWDMDGDAEDRKRGLEQARSAMQKLAQFQIVLGCPDRMREAWVLAGFDPQSPHEQRRLDDEARQLGFRPNAQAHRLAAPDMADLRSAKRVLAVLTGGDPEREAKCWTEATLATIRERGAGSGLAAFLDEIEQRLAASMPPSPR